MRELAAEALSALVRYDPEYFANFVLEKLIPKTLSPDLCTRHGATLAAGEVVSALHQCDYALSHGRYSHHTFYFLKRFKKSEFVRDSSLD